MDLQLCVGDVNLVNDTHGVDDGEQFFCIKALSFASVLVFQFTQYRIDLLCVSFVVVSAAGVPLSHKVDIVLLCPCSLVHTMA